MYMENEAPEILNQPIGQLGFSRSLVHMLELNRFDSLKKLLDCPMEEWFGFIGFSQHLLNELMNYLESNRLLPLVRE